MDFTLTDEQRMVVETAAGLLSKECPTSIPRRVLDDPTAAAPLWSHLREWVALGDGPIVDLVLFLEQTGRALVPGPYLASAAWALPLLRLCGASDTADRVASGQVIATVVGAGPLTMEAGGADVLVELAGDRVRIHARAGLTGVTTLDGTRRMYEVDLTTPAQSQHVLSEGAVDTWWDRAWVSLAAEMVGTARRLLDMTVAHAKERVQFEQPIGAFQAVQHQLADSALEVERATAAVYEATMVLDAGRPAVEGRRLAHVAKAAAGAAATTTAKQAIQTHGGIGFTWDHDLHLFIRRAYATEHLLGTRAWHHEQLGELLVGSRR